MLMSRVMMILSSGGEDEISVSNETVHEVEQSPEDLDEGCGSL